MTYTNEDIERLVPEARHHGMGIWTYGNAVSTDRKMFLALLTTRAENERLREALSQITRTNDNGTPWFSKYEAIDIARQALEKINKAGGA